MGLESGDGFWVRLRCFFLDVYLWFYVFVGLVFYVVGERLFGLGVGYLYVFVFFVRVVGFGCRVGLVVC